MLANGQVLLQKLLSEHREIVHVCYNEGASARFRPLELRIMEGAHPICAEPRRYPTEKRQLLHRYVSQLKRIEARQEVCAHGMGVTAVLLAVPKRFTCVLYTYSGLSYG